MCFGHVDIRISQYDRFVAGHSTVINESITRQGEWKHVSASRASGLGFVGADPCCSSVGYTDPPSVCYSSVCVPATNGCMARSCLRRIIGHDATHGHSICHTLLIQKLLAPTLCCDNDEFMFRLPTIVIVEEGPSVVLIPLIQCV